MVGGSDNGARRVEDRRATGVSVYLGGKRMLDAQFVQGLP